MKTPSLRRLLPLALIGLSTAAFAQDAPPPAAAPRRPMPPPSNLQVLPKDMTAQQVVAIMRNWEGELGVECEYCHAKDPATGRNNFASDANPKKDTARLMLRMTMAINQDSIAKITPPTEARVGCGTCHRGMPKPAVFVPPPHQRPGPPPATPPTPPPPGS